LNEDLENVPTYVRGVTHRSLRGDQGLNQRANAFGRGLSQPATHHQASGEPGFNATFGCATTEFTEGRVFQENPRTGAVMSVRVGAPKTQVGLLKLYNMESDGPLRIHRPRGQNSLAKILALVYDPGSTVLRPTEYSREVY
jgi:hypothetical protein